MHRPQDPNGTKKKKEEVSGLKRSGPPITRMRRVLIMEYISAKKKKGKKGTRSASDSIQQETNHQSATISRRAPAHRGSQARRHTGTEEGKDGKDGQNREGRMKEMRKAGYARCQTALRLRRLRLINLRLLRRAELLLQLVA